MALDLTTKDLDIQYSKELKQENIPVLVNVSAGAGAISRVISIMNKVCVDNITANLGSAQVEGRIHSAILIKNVEGWFECLNGSTNFNVPIVNSEIIADSAMLATAVEQGLSGVQASENLVSFSVNVGLKPTLFVVEKNKLLENIDKLAEQKRDNIEYNDIVAVNSQDFDISLELDLPGSISRVLNIDAQTVLKKAEAGNDMIALQGEIYCNMVYLTADDEPKLKNHRYSQEFTHEVLANGVLMTDVVNANLQTVETTFELNGEINSTKGTVILNNKLKANLVVSQIKTAEAVVDAFCPHYTLGNVYSSITQQKIESFFVNEKVDGSISLGEDEARVDKVLAVGRADAVITELAVDDGNATIRGKLLSDVVYKLDTDEGDIESVLAEIPFEINYKNEMINKQTNINVDIKICDIDARNKRAKEIDILAELACAIEISNNNAEAILSEVTLDAKRPQSTTAFGYYIIPEAKSLWDASKMLLVSGDLIMEQNPDLTFPITEPQKVIIYKQKLL